MVCRHLWALARLLLCPLLQIWSPKEWWCVHTTMATVVSDNTPPSGVPPDDDIMVAAGGVVGGSSSMSAVASSLPAHGATSREGDGEEGEGGELSSGSAGPGTSASGRHGSQGAAGVPMGAASMENSIDLLLPSAIMDALTAPEGHDMHSLSRLSQVGDVCVHCVRELV